MNNCLPLIGFAKISSANKTRNFWDLNLRKFLPLTLYQHFLKVSFCVLQPFLKVTFCVLQCFSKATLSVLMSCKYCDVSYHMPHDLHVSHDDFLYFTLYANVFGGKKVHASIDKRH